MKVSDESRGGDRPAGAAPTGRRVALVTGASGGLGTALVEAFVANGWDVAAAGHAEAPRARPGVIWTGCLDVVDRASVGRAFEAVDRAAGRLDALINNAGVTEDGLLATMPDAAWDRVVGTCLKGAFLCSRSALERMLPRGAGHIVNVSSLAARTGAIGQANYAAAKAGLIGLTLSLAREVGTEGISVNAVMPGVLATRMTAALPRQVLERFARASVLGRINTVEEAARWIVDLAGSRGVSGQVWELDGRISRWC